MSRIAPRPSRSVIRIVFYWFAFLITGAAFLLGMVATADGWIEWWHNGGRYPVYFAGLHWVLGLYAWGLGLAGFFGLGLVLRFSRWRHAVKAASILTAIALFHALVGLVVQSAYFTAEEAGDKLLFVALMTLAILLSILPMCSIWLDWPRRKTI